MEKKIKTIQKDGEEPTPIEILEQSIIEIAKAMKKFQQSRVKQSTIVMLIQGSSHMSKRDIEIVLNNLMQLEEIFLKKKI